VTAGISVPELRSRAEKTLAALLAEPERFGAVARELSNCPSGQQDGNLGQIGRGDMVPEFEHALFRLGPTGILGELVKTRHGFHIVAIIDAFTARSWRMRPCGIASRSGSRRMWRSGRCDSMCPSWPAKRRFAVSISMPRQHRSSNRRNRTTHSMRQR
jgi:hypothetical protein